MSEEPTNRELAMMISSFRELMELKFEQNEKDHNSVNRHLKTLNAQVVKNTKFRTRWAGAYFGVGALGVILGVWQMLKNLMT